MYNQYRSTSRPACIVAAAAALVTVLWLFDFVAALGGITPRLASEVRASVSSLAAEFAAGPRLARGA